MIANFEGQLRSAVVALCDVCSTHACILVRSLDSEIDGTIIAIALSECGVVTLSGMPLVMQKDWPDLAQKALVHYDELWFFEESERARLAYGAIECASLTTDSLSLTADPMVAKVVEKEMRRFGAFVVLADGAMGVDVVVGGDGAEALLEMIEKAV